MIAASAYVLNVPPDRRELILDRADENHYYPTRVAAEPVPFFQHSKRAALIVLASFENGAITHVADGRKGASAGTGLVRLNMEDLQPLKKPVRFGKLKKAVRRLSARSRRLSSWPGNCSALARSISK